MVNDFGEEIHMTNSGNKQWRDARKSYNKLTAQFAQNAVRKKIIEIKRGGARAADELIDQITGDLTKNGRKTGREARGSFAESRLLSHISKNRGKWRNFIIEAAASVDVDTLSTFGVNFVYGGLMTSSTGGIGWASLLDITCKNGSISADRARKISETIFSGKSRGCMVWIVKGSGGLTPEMLRIYRYHPECAFILCDFEHKGEDKTIGSDFEQLLKLKNIALLADERDSAEMSNKLRRAGLLYMLGHLSVDNIISSAGKGSAVSIPKELSSFLESPSFPLRVGNIFEHANTIEALLSEGKSRVIPSYEI